jgi:hypothetical protein
MGIVCVTMPIVQKIKGACTKNECRVRCKTSCLPYNTHRVQNKPRCLPPKGRLSPTKPPVHHTTASIYKTKPLLYVATVYFPITTPFMAKLSGKRPRYARNSSLLEPSAEIFSKKNGQKGQKRTL